LLDRPGKKKRNSGAYFIGEGTNSLRTVWAREVELKNFPVRFTGLGGLLNRGKGGGKQKGKKSVQPKGLGNQQKRHENSTASQGRGVGVRTKSPGGPKKGAEGKEGGPY